MHGRIANRVTGRIRDPAVSTCLYYATLRYFRRAPPYAESGTPYFCFRANAADGDFTGFRHRWRQLGRMALPRKRRHRAPHRWSEGLDDLHDYLQPQPTRVPSRSRIASPDPIIVTDDWPEQVPIGDAELRVMEGALRKELDALFGPLP